MENMLIIGKIETKRNFKLILNPSRMFVALKYAFKAKGNVSRIY